MYDHNINNTEDIMLNNRLFCSFVLLEGLQDLINQITSKYKILNNKLFVLRIQENDELVCTYNIDSINLTGIPENTILVHRKKETNTLYSLNGLNAIVRLQNGGKEDPHFPINWYPYRNSIVLTQGDELRILKTKIYKIIET